VLIDDADYEWLMINASHCKVHSHATGIRGENQDMSRTKGGLNTMRYLAVDAHGMPVRIIATEATWADRTQAQGFIAGIPVQHLIAGKDYDSDATIEQAESQGVQAVIPPRK